MHLSHQLTHEILINYEIIVDLRQFRNQTINMEKLSIQEEEVMIYIWELECCIVKDIVSKFPEPVPPYTTIASIVKNLERKGYVAAKRIGNTYQYTPAIRESEYKRSFINRVVGNYFENSYKEMVSFFAKDKKISAEELKEIIEMIEKRNDHN